MTEEILQERRGRLTIVTLNRPRALNALTFGMVRALDAWLDAWSRDDEVAAVVIRGAGGRAFCAGGDIRALHAARQAGDPLTRDFYRAEYRLNHRIKTWPKPYIALLDGIVMGGGVGVSIHGSHVLATGRCRFAMPEVGIGFFPDVGATWFLPRCPGALGMYLGLTGARIGATDMRYAGLASHHVAETELDDLLDALVAAPWSGDARHVADRTIAGFARDPGPAPLAELQGAIDRCLAAGSVEDILDALANEDADWSRETAAALRTKSPTSLKVAFRQLREGARLADFAAAMALEYRLSQRFMAGPDFFEGVRAAVIDKDQAPRWRPATLQQVDAGIVDGYFRPLDEPDLTFA